MNKTKKGFTLIELLVVVLIIGILAAVAMPQYSKVVEKSRATEALTILKSVADAKTVVLLSTGCGGDIPWADLDINFTDLQTCGGGPVDGYLGTRNKNFAYSTGGNPGDYYTNECPNIAITAPFAHRHNTNGNDYILYYCPGMGARCKWGGCKKAGFSRYSDCIGDACYAM